MYPDHADKFLRWALQARAGNLAVSPACVELGLAALALGATGETASELAAVGAHPTPAAWARDLAAFWGPLLANDESRAAAVATLEARNAALMSGRDPEPDLSWKELVKLDEICRRPQFNIGILTLLNNDARAQDQYVAALRRLTERADIVSTDFNQPLAATALANDWISRATDGAFTRVVDPSIFQPLTRLILVAALRFVGQWDSPFEPELTQAAPFEGAGLVRMMNQETAVRYALVDQDGGSIAVPEYGQFPATPAGSHHLVALPYGQGRFECVLIVPSGGTDPDLTMLPVANYLATLEANGQFRPVQLHVPRFEILSDLTVTRGLPELGVRRAIDEAEAELEGLIGEHVWLDSAALISKLTFDEEGTVAAAVFLGAVAGGAAESNEPLIPVVRADRPFLFVIRDRESGRWLFAGRVTEPESA